MSVDPQYPYSEQQLPKTEPVQVCPPPLTPQAPSTETGADADGDATTDDETTVLD